ncbi:MAG: tail fiber domain-containing protein, partial [Oscillospiraceae bacterium]|nr:tail fiber domain-containing protein [Oscillospiraceae bacterium]
TCSTSGTAATAAKADALQISNGAAYTLKVNYNDQVCIPLVNGQIRVWNEARYLMADPTNKDIAVEWVLSGSWAFCPRRDASHALGLAYRRWSGIYLTSSPSVTSDRREKHDIAALDEERAAAFIMALKPAAYKYNDGTSGRTHWGLIAQDVEEAMAACGISGMEFAGLIKAETPREKKDGTAEAEGPEYSYSLRYEEFVAPVIALLKAQEKRLERQEKEMERQQQQLERQEAQITALWERAAAPEKEREEK